MDGLPYIPRTVGIAILSLCPVLWESHLCLGAPHGKHPFAESKRVKEKPLVTGVGLAHLQGTVLCLFPCWPFNWIT